MRTRLSAMFRDEVADRRLSFDRNAVIYRQADPAAKVYEVISGIVRTCRFLIDGRRHIDAFYLQGDTFGLEVTPEYICSAEAVTRVEVLVKGDIPSSELGDLLGRELRRTQNHAVLLAMTAPERVATFLLEMIRQTPTSISEEVELSMSRKDIADYLGLTIETVSRTLAQLENESAIALLTSRRIVLRDCTALRRLALELGQLHRA
jgi:CRP/FNR family transcriptional regulator, nitrogen fixation regulation protein